MAITTPAELETAVGNWLDRGDLTSRIPEFIALAEARFNREIRTPDMLTRDDLATIDAQYETVPTDYLATERYTLLTTPPRRLTYLAPEDLAEQREHVTQGGKPYYYSVVGGSFEFLPDPDQAYAGSHLYYAKIDLTTTSWLLTNHPDVCLKGALVEAEAYIMNDPRLPVWKTQVDEGIMSINKAGDDKFVAGVMRAPIRSFG